MKKFAFFFLPCIFLFVSLACASEVQTSQTPDAGYVDVMATMAMQQLDAKATEQAVGISYTGTAQVSISTANAQGTQMAVAATAQERKDAQATEARARQDAVATEQQRRADIAATQARNDAISTAEMQQRQVSWTATAEIQNIWNQATMTAWPVHNAWTQQAVIIDQQMATAQVAMKELEVEQQRQKNTPEWVIPLLIAITVTGAGVLYLIRYSRVREFKNDYGQTETVLLDNANLYHLSLLPAPAIVGADTTTPTMPFFTDAENQAEIVRRAQGIRALAAMPQSVTTKDAAVDLYNGIWGVGQMSPNRFEILDANEAPPAKLLDANVLKSLEKDWKDSDD